MNILLIEDDEMLSGALSFNLTAKGYNVFPAIDGKIALDIVCENIFDLVICDLMVPFISGPAFLSVRGKFMSLDIPIIVMSALDNAEKMLADIGVEYWAFLKKPFDYEELFELVKQSQVKGAAKNKVAGKIS